jgi:hypothetical protein
MKNIEKGRQPEIGDLDVAFRAPCANPEMSREVGMDRSDAIQKIQPSGAAFRIFNRSGIGKEWSNRNRWDGILRLEGRISGAFLPLSPFLRGEMLWGGRRK